MLLVRLRQLQRLSLAILDIKVSRRPMQVKVGPIEVQKAFLWWQMYHLDATQARPIQTHLDMPM